MIKSELIQRLARANPHLYQRDVERIVGTIFEEIAQALSRGDRVELRDFGAFSVRTRPARIGRNPRTGEPVAVAAKAVPFFKTGKELRERLNRQPPADTGASETPSTPETPSMPETPGVSDGTRAELMPSGVAAGE